MAKFKVGDKVLVDINKNGRVRATIAKVGGIVLGQQVYQVVGETSGAASAFEKDLTPIYNSTNSLPSRSDTGAWMRILEASPAANRVMFKIDPSKLSVKTKGVYNFLKPGEFKVKVAPRFPDVTLKNVRQIKNQLASDNGFTGGTVVVAKTGDVLDVDHWSSLYSPYEKMLLDGSRKYLEALDKLQGVSIDYEAAAKGSARQDRMDELYRKSQLNSCRNSVVANAIAVTNKEIPFDDRMVDQMLRHIRDVKRGLEKGGDVEIARKILSDVKRDSEIIEDIKKRNNVLEEWRKMAKVVGMNFSTINNSVVANAIEWKAKNSVATNAEVSDHFEVGKVYGVPYDRNWLCKVLSRTPTSIRVAIKSVRDTTWHGKDEQVTLRINPKRSEEMDCEVARGLDWEFWASEKK